MWCVCAVTLAIFVMVSQGVEIMVVSSMGIAVYDTANQTARKEVMKGNELMVKEVDYHYERGEVYALTKRQILRCALHGGLLQHRPVVYSEDEYSLISVALDWVRDRLYWTGGPVFMIHTSTLSGTDHRVIYRGYYIETHINKLLVDPIAGLLVWAWCNRIFSTDLNGKNLKEITFPEVLGNIRSRVKNLALDPTRGRVYFLAGFEDDDVWLMMSGKYDGSEFRRHDSVSRFTYTLAALGQDLFWVARETGRVPYTPGGFKRLTNLALYHIHTDLGGLPRKVMELNTGAVWSIKICDPQFQIRGNISFPS